MNLLESITSFLQGTMKPDHPLHYGEAMALWTVLAAVQDARQLCLTLLNHTDDPDLKQIMERAVANFEEPVIREIESLLKSEGVPLPTTTPDKPKADPSTVPPGARITDAETAQLVIAKLDGLLMICGSGLIQSLRDDVTAMFLRYQMNLLGEGVVLKKTMRERGWLKVPPFHQQAAES